MNLEETILRAVGKVIESGAIESAIENAVEKTVVSVVHEELGRYGDFSKTLQAAVKKSLRLQGDLDLPTYNDTILKIVKSKVEGITRNSIERQVAEQLSALLEPAPESITLSALIDAFIKHVKDRRKHDCTCHTYDEITCHVSEKDNGFRYVNLDEDGKKTPNQCGIQIGIHGDEVFSLNLRRCNVDSDLFSGPFYGFEKMLFQMKAARSKLVFDVDQDEVDTQYSLDD